MKSAKLFFLIIALGCGITLARADEGKLAIGVQGGGTFPDFKVKNTSLANQYGNKNGWLAGAYLEAGLWSITLRPEINYVTKSYSVTNIANVQNHYLEIPVLIKINPLKGSTVSPFLLLGPQWSKQTSSDITVLGVSSSFTNSDSSWDLAAVGGLGIEFNFMENVGLNVQGRYAYGLRDVGASPTQIKTRTFYALAGLSIQNPF